MLNLVSEETGRQLLAQHGFTVEFDEGDNGDQGRRLYFCRDGEIPRNKYGWPIEVAQLDGWGPDAWSVAINHKVL